MLFGITPGPGIPWIPACPSSGRGFLLWFVGGERAGGLLGTGDGHGDLWAGTATTRGPASSTDRSCHPAADVPCGTPVAVVEVTPAKSGW